jgi:glycogen(starch) synthase
VRILLINYEFPPLGGGAGNATANIARGLVELGDGVQILTSHYPGLPWHETQGGYGVRRCPAIRSRLDRSTPVEMVSFILGGIPLAISVGQTWQPDVACAFFGLPSGPLAYLLKRVYGVPYVVSLRGGDVPGFLPAELGTYHRLTRPITRAIWQSAGAVLANSTGLGRLAQTTWPEAPLVIIPNGVDTDQFTPDISQDTNEGLRLLYVGRLVRSKGVDLVLEALQDLPEVRLRIVGDGPERGYLTRLALDLGVKDRVEFSGWLGRPQLPRQYHWANAFVLLSEEEGMPNVLLEAMASGLPIIATDNYANRELVEPGKNGRLVASRDRSELAEAIRQLRDDADLRQRWGTNGRQAALARNWASVATKYHNVLCRVAARL